jgi:hypothetical protein
VNHINILFAIAVNLMLEAEKQQIEIPKSTKDSFYKWFAKRTRTGDCETNGAGKWWGVARVSPNL